MAADISRQHAILLAGSLSPENVVEAIDAVCPWGVDVSSGVEADKGRKDHRKIKTLIRNAKG
jgi:phosphoribosylanthranilate isomerase